MIKVFIISSFGCLDKLAHRGFSERYECVGERRYNRFTTIAAILESDADVVILEEFLLKEVYIEFVKCLKKAGFKGHMIIPRTKVRLAIYEDWFPMNYDYGFSTVGYREDNLDDVIIYLNRWDEYLRRK
jgi:hypothetical protein